MLNLAIISSSMFLSYNTQTMVITHHGGQFFKITFGDITLAFDPISKQSKLASTKFGADIAFVSINHPDFNGIDQVTHGNKAPHVVKGAGEYEFGQVTARGFGVKTTYDGIERFNNIYQVRLEDTNIIFLGALGSAEIDPKILGELGDIDILFVPIGGGNVLDVPAATKLAVKLEAKLIIPMHFDKTSLTAFLKEIGSEAALKTDKLTIKKKEISELEGEVRVITY